MEQEMNRPRIIVTGGAGFIGSHTAVALSEAGYRPVIIDDLRNSHESVISSMEDILQSPLEWHRVDCGDKAGMSAVFSEPVAGAIHFAADKAVGESVANPEKYFDNNIGGTARFVSLLREHNVPHLVFSSSCTVYGEAQQLPVTESAPLLPAASPYGFTKQACEFLLQSTHAAAEGKLGMAILRYFNPVGAHPSAKIGELPLGPPSNLVPFLTQAVSGLRGPLTVFGDDYPTPDGTCIRDYLHVCDLAEAHVAALKWLEKNPSSIDTFNLGTGKGTSVKEVVASFQRSTGLQVPHQMGARRPGDVAAIYADPSKATQQLGWTSKRTLDTCLADAWRWQKQMGAE
jgi:UDP-glucose 4-epimerase